MIDIRYDRYYDEMLSFKRDHNITTYNSSSLAEAISIAVCQNEDIEFDLMMRGHLYKVLELYITITSMTLSITEIYNKYYS